MSSKPVVAGVGMIQFTKPGQSKSYAEMGGDAVRLALADAGIAYDQIGQAYVGYVYGDSTAGQLALYQVGQSGIPVVNVNNNCSTGSSALFLARQAVESGVVDVALALGFEEMKPGALGFVFHDRMPAMAMHEAATATIQGWDPERPMAIQYFGGAAQEHHERYGTRPETFAAIAVKARQHAANNPLALFRNQLTVEEVLASPTMFGPITRLQCCPPTCGAAAAIIVSEGFARRHGLDTRVRIAGQAMATDMPSTFESKSMIKVIGYDLARSAALTAYEQAGIGPDDVQVVELHDCFTSNELLSYEALGLASEGGGEQFVMDGDNSYGGRFVVNPSGGLLSKGHPIGATGLAQCYELTKQLRGQAEARQVEGAKIALQHNLGLGSACVVTVYERHER